LTASIVTNGTVNTSVTGSNTVTYTVSDSSGNIASQQRTVTVGLPGATTLPVTDLTATSATLNGQVNPIGLPTTAWFEWGTDGGYGQQTTPVALGSGVAYVSFSASLTGLVPGWAYQCRVVASNSAGVVFGADVTFGKAPFTLPTATLSHLMNIGRNPAGYLENHGTNAGREDYTMIGGGNDIYDKTDEFTFAYHEFAGDFDVRVQVTELQPTARWSKAGLMVRESLAEDSRMLLTRVTPPDVPTGYGGNGVNNQKFQYRTGRHEHYGLGDDSNGGRHEDGSDEPPAYPNAWLRLERVGSVFNAYRNFGGSVWELVGSQDTAAGDWLADGHPPFAGKVLLGLAVSRNGGNPTCRAVFKNYTETAPQFCLGWASSEGIPSQVRLLFNRPVGAGALAFGNYEVRQQGSLVTVTNARPGRTAQEVFLMLATGLSEGSRCDVAALDGVRDSVGDALSAGRASASFVHGEGFELREIHVQRNMIPGPTLDWWLGSTAYGLGLPVASEGAPATMGNLVFEDNGVPDDYSHEQFSARIVGVLQPPANGNYRFACASDDQGALYLSTDDQPAHKRLIAREPDWNGAREYDIGQNQASRGSPATNQSLAQPLTGGRGYFLELAYSENWYGNHGSATWDAGSGAAFVNFQSPIAESNFVPSRFAYGSIFYTLGCAQVTAGPSDVDVYVGSPATFEVVVDGTPPYTFQWLMNGTNVPGATAQTFTLPAVTEAMANAQIRVRVDNLAACLVETTNATLTVVPTILLNLVRDGSDVVLNWTGGQGPYQVQKTTSMGAACVWEDVGGPVTTNSMRLSCGPGNVFLRVRGQ
jgi:hypothetical protein